MEIRKTFLLLFCVAFVISSCTKDDFALNKSTEEKTGLNFSITETDYENVKTNATRSDRTLTQSELVSLGDNIEATVEERVPSSYSHTRAETRAITTPKHYSIRAYQNGILKGRMKGTFNGNTFTPDAGTASKMSLEPGEYDFLCYNDKFHEVGEDIELSLVDAKDAYFCQKKVTIYNQAKQDVPFEMKHACARMNVTLECFGKTGTNVVANISPVTSNAPTKITYDRNSNSFVPTNGVVTGGTQTYSTMHDPDKRTSDPAWINADEYLYFLPGTDCTKLQMSFVSGTMFGRSLLGTGAIRFLTVGELFQANKSYHLQVTLWPKWDYLFSDGTTGSLASNPTKNPIGLVVLQKTATSRGLAAALKSIPNLTMFATWNGGGTFSFTHGFNTTSYATLPSAMLDMAGEHWAYDASGTPDGIVKVNDQASFPGPYAAAHFDPGYTITGANVGRWFIPSLGQVISLFNTMARVAGFQEDYWSSWTDWNTLSSEYDFVAMSAALTRRFPLRGPNSRPIGSGLIFSGATSFGLVTSTAINDVAIATLGGANGKFFVKKGIIDKYGEIRPFIHF